MKYCCDLARFYAGKSYQSVEKIRKTNLSVEKQIKEQCVLNKITYDETRLLTRLCVRDSSSPRLLASSSSKACSN